jgi:hypothetical protein
MSITSKSPQDVARAALVVGMDALPLYSHPNSPRVFTQPQLFACLVLKGFFRTDYRGIMTILRDSIELRQILGLSHVPHFTTLQKASIRLLKVQWARALLAQSLRHFRGGVTTVSRGAFDSSGFDCGHISSYFVKRKSREKNLYQTTKYTRFAKLEAASDTRNHLIVGCIARRGPNVDVNRFRPLLKETLRFVKLKTLVADAGYDSEPNHRFARDEHAITTLIPAESGRPTIKPLSGKYRQLMKTTLNTQRKRRRLGYGQRWQIETVFSMIKRRQSTSVAGRTYNSQCRDLRLLCITHNVMILLLGVFYRALLTAGDDEYIRREDWPLFGRLAEGAHLRIGKQTYSKLSTAELAKWFNRKVPLTIAFQA